MTGKSKLNIPSLPIALLLVVGLGLCSADDGWITGRATWFDVGPDMSKANCHFSWAPTGRNVGAWPDVQDGFGSSCGKCFEVRCRNADFADGNGDTLSRSSACYDEKKSVVITIVDACPCHYPNNAHSNRRWCCGDMNHLDISQETFQQLADLNVGVIGLSYREVDCYHQPGSNGEQQNSSPSSTSVNGNAQRYDNDNSNTNTYQTSQSGPDPFGGQIKWPVGWPWGTR